MDWLGSMLDVVNLDSACCSAGQRAIFHQTLAGMKAMGQLDKFNTTAHYRWLFERGMTIVAVTLNPKFLHRVGDILPVFRDATALTLSDPIASYGGCWKDRADPTSAQFDDLLAACPQLASVSVDVSSCSQLPNLLQLIADATSSRQISSLTCCTQHLAKTPPLFLEQAQLLVKTIASRGHLKHLHVSVPEKINAPIVETISADCRSLLGLSLGILKVNPMLFATMLSHLTALESLQVIWFPLPKALPDNNQYVLSLLSHLPNLSVFGTCDCDALDYSLFVLMLQKWPRMRSFHVQMWISYIINDHGGCDLKIVKSHPSLELLIDLPIPAPVHSLKLCFQHISHPHVFSHLLDRFGRTLVELAFLERYYYLRDALGTVHDDSNARLAMIAAKCSNLVRLHCGSLEGELIPDEKRCTATIALIADTYGPRLKSFKFTITNDRFVVTEQSFLNFAKKCPNLEELVAINCADFTAHAVDQLLQHCRKLRVLAKHYGVVSNEAAINSILKWRRDRPFQFYLGSHEATRAIKAHVDAAFEKAPLKGIKNCWKDFKYELDFTNPNAESD